MDEKVLQKIHKNNVVFEDTFVLIFNSLVSDVGCFETLFYYEVNKHEASKR